MLDNDKILLNNLVRLKLFNEYLNMTKKEQNIFYKNYKKYDLGNLLFFKE